MIKLFSLIFYLCPEGARGDGYAVARLAIQNLGSDTSEIMNFMVTSCLNSLVPIPTPSAHTSVFILLLNNFRGALTAEKSRGSPGPGMRIIRIEPPLATCFETIFQGPRNMA